MEEFNDNEVKKLKRRNTALIILIITLVLSVVAISSYAYFLWDDNKADHTIDVARLVDNFNYQYLTSGKTKTVSDLTPEEMLLITEMSIMPSNYRFIDVEITKKDSVDLKGEKYPDYSKETNKAFCDDVNGKREVGAVGELKELLQLLGFTVDKIEKVDLQILGCIYSPGFMQYKVIEDTTISEKMMELFGTNKNIFDKDFKYRASYDGGLVNDYIYDKNSKKLIVSYKGGHEGGSDELFIVDQYRIGNEYKIKFVEVYINYDDENASICNPSNISDKKLCINVNKEEKKYGDNFSEIVENKVLDFKDELDNYEITFKKVGDNYQFVSIDYIK